LSPKASDAKEAGEQAKRITENIRQENKGNKDAEFDPDLSDG